MRSILTVLLAALLAWPPAASAQGQPDWRQAIDALPPLTPIVVQFRDGKKLSGTVVGIRAEGFEVLRRTRYPEPARFVRYEDVATIERHQTGISSGAKATLAAASVLTTLAVLTLAYLSRID